MFPIDIIKIKYLLLIEIFLLSFYALFDYIPVLILLALLLFIPIIYYSFNNPIIGVQVLLFSIFAGSLGVAKVGSKTPSIFLVDIIFVFIFALFCIKVAQNFAKEINIPPIIWAWIGFLIWGVLSYFIAIEKFRALVLWKNYFAGFITFSLTYFALKNKKQIKVILLGFVLWGLALSLIEIKILLDLGGLGGGIVSLFLKKNLLATSWGKSNYLATFFVMIIPVAIGYLFYTKSLKLKSFITIVLLFLTSALLLTLSRGGILAMMISLIILFSKLISKKTLIPLLVSVFAVIIIVLLNPLTYVLLDRITTFESSASYFSRINFYKDVWDTFLNNTILGVGFGNLGLYAQFVIPLSYFTSAHNIVLGMLGETGIIGAMLFLSILGIVFYESITKYRIEKDSRVKVLRWSLISSIAGVVIHSLMEPNFESMHFSVMIWCLIATNLRLDLLRSAFDRL